MSNHIIGWDALGVAVHQPEPELRRGRPLIRRQQEPPHPLHMVLWDAFAVGVHAPEEDLRVSVPLLSTRPQRIDLRRLRLHRLTQC